MHTTEVRYQVCEQPVGRESQLQQWTPIDTKLVLNNHTKCHHTIHSKVNLQNGRRNCSSTLNLLPTNAHTLYHMYPSQKVKLGNPLTTVAQTQLSDRMSQASSARRYTVGNTGHSVLTTVLHLWNILKLHLDCASLVCLTLFCGILWPQKVFSFINICTSEKI